jgi:hypothetical protein
LLSVLQNLCACAGVPIRQKLRVGSATIALLGFNQTAGHADIFTEHEPIHRDRPGHAA